MRWSDASERQYNMKSSKYLDISILFHRLFKYSKSTQGFFELSQIVIYQLYSIRSLSQKSFTSRKSTIKTLETGVKYV